MNGKLNIAVDGPSGSGKSTLARGLARHYGIVYVDTGALYRTVGLQIQRDGLSSLDTDGIIAALAHTDISVRLEGVQAQVLLSGEPVGDEIRTPVSSMYASDVSKIPEVRAFLLETQKSIARSQSCVMDGRDIGTVIMPDADVKLFLCASDGERAERRAAELREKGIDVTLGEIADAMKKRDANDRGREISPAVPASDAVFIDNSSFTKEETLAKAISIIDKTVSI